MHTKHNIKLLIQAPNYPKLQVFFFLNQLDIKAESLKF